MQHSIKGCVQSLCDWPHLILCYSHAYQEGTTEWLYIKVVTWLFLINRKEIPNYLFYDWNFTTEIEVRKLILIASEIAQGGQLPCPAGWCSLVLPPAQSHTPRHQARGIHLPVPLIQILLWSCIVALLHHSFAEYLNRNLEFLRFISSSMTTVSWIFAFTESFTGNLRGDQDCRFRLVRSRSVVQVSLVLFSTSVAHPSRGQGQPAADGAHKTFPHTLFLFSI